MSQPVSARRLALAVLALALAMAAALVPGDPAGAAHDRNGEAVDGVQQAYRPARAEAGGDVTISPDFFFHGTKPNATFDDQAPAGSEPKTQTTDPSASSDIPGDPASAFWTGPYNGTLDGALNIRWFWSSANPIGNLIRVDAVVTVFADANVDGTTDQKDKVVGRTNVTFSVDPLTPQENITSVPVDGDVNDNLTIQVVPFYSDSGPGLTTTYDSDDFPAGFEALGAGAAPATPASTPAAYDGPPFVVQTVNVGRDAAEPTIGINKKGTAFYAAGAFDALPKGSPRQLARTELLRSRDGGLTWESVQPPLAGVTTDPPTTLDPFVWLDEETGRVFNPELYAACTSMNYSDDEGESYETNRAACGEYVNDHQTVFTGPPPPNLEDQMGDYPNVLYYCFNRVVDSNCGRSLDGGESFEPATGDNVVGTAFLGFDPEAGGLCGGLHGHGDTDSEGRVFIPKGHCGYPWVAISEDGAETFKRVQVSDEISAASTHLAIATDAEDNVYMVWWDTQEHLPYLAISRDHGDTWGTPMMIAPPGVKEVNFPVIEAGDAGRVAINFPGTTVGDQDDEKRPWNQYIVASTNALSDNPLFVSTTANPVDDPIHRGDCLGRCAGMFDFLDIQISPHDGDIWATATDTCTNDPVDEPEDEAVDCVNNPDDANGNSSAGSGVASDEEGLAIRQLSGPRLSTGVGDTDEDRDPDPDTGGPGTDGPGTDDGVGDDDDNRGGPTLPATGGGLGLMLLGAAAMPAAVLLARRRR